MSYLKVRINEGEDVQPLLLWDSVWSPWDGVADWAIADASETQNRGGLTARATLHTAVILSLFTDKRMPDQHPLRYLIDDGDQRGWFGDGEDIRPELGETEMGSLLWIFERAHLNEEIRRWVEAVALDALAPLIYQKVAVRIDATAVGYFAFNRVELTIDIFAREGQRIYSHRFDDIWQQSRKSPTAPTFRTAVNTNTT